MQLTLFRAEQTSKEIRTLPIADLALSPFNPRTTRPDTYVDRLAERINQNGYEITRAVWAHKVDGHYEIFAGGTRLEAARRAGLNDIPVVVHDGFSDVELVRLAEQDNENDEYHEPVPIVDVWLSYKALAEQGWTQQQIAEAKGCSQQFVSLRLALASLPQMILQSFTTIPLLAESHGRELLRLLQCSNLSPWLTQEQAMLEIIDACESNPIARQFKKAVDRYNGFIELAGTFADTLDEEHRWRFFSRLAEKKARSAVIVRDEIDHVRLELAEETRRAEEDARLVLEAAERDRIEAEREERMAQQRAAWFAEHVTLHVGELVDMAPQIADNSVDLIFTDPPYAQDNIAVYGLLAQVGARILKPGGSLITYAGHYALPEIFPLMTPHLRFWWTLAVQHSGRNARLPGKWIFVQWKPLLWFVKNERRGTVFVADHIKSHQPDKDLHDWEQHTTEAAYYIEQLTEPGDVVCDLFCGSGTTLLAAIQQGRHVIGVDIERRHIVTTRDRLNAYHTRTFGAQEPRG